MGLRDRTRRLEKRMGLRDKDKPCPECGGRIVYEEILEDGTVTYPQGEPCEACGSGGWGGAPGRIVVESAGTPPASDPWVLEERRA